MNNKYKIIQHNIIIMPIFLNIMFRRIKSIKETGSRGVIRYMLFVDWFVNQCPVVLLKARGKAPESFVGVSRRSVVRQCFVNWKK